MRSFFFLKNIFAVNLTKLGPRGQRSTAARSEIKPLKETNGGGKLCAG